MNQFMGPLSSHYEVDFISSLTIGGSDVLEKFAIFMQSR